MSVTFTKLFSSITESTVWCEDSDTRVVWITMLAMSDRYGRVWASIPGLANRAQVSLESTEKALEKFLAPDPYSRTVDYDGRRIEKIDGGWLLLNHEKYRAIKDDEERKEYKRLWIKEKREKERQEKIADVDSVDKCTQMYTYTEADTDTDTDTDTKERVNGENFQLSPASAAEKIPIQKIVDLYHEILPTLPRVQKLNKKRIGYIQQRWREDLPRMENWRNYFNFVKRNDFLMGRCNPTNGHSKPFRADLEWLTKPENFIKVAEDKYV